MRCVALTGGLPLGVGVIVDGFGGDDVEVGPDNVVFQLFAVEQLGDGVKGVLSHLGEGLADAQGLRCLLYTSFIKMYESPCIFARRVLK